MLAANPFFDAAAMICDRIEMEALSVRNLLGLYIYIYMYRNWLVMAKVIIKVVIFAQVEKSSRNLSVSPLKLDMDIGDH